MALEKIEKKGELLAFVVRNSNFPEGAHFVSEENHSFQIGFHHRRKGYRYKRHITLQFSKVKDFNPNKVYYVQEGRLMIRISDEKGDPVSTVELNKGDLICFISGAHDVEMAEDARFIEIKQGPYRGEQDKRFLE